MKKNQFQRIVLPLACVFLVTLMTGCGRAHIKTLKKAEDISAYNEIYVANVDVSSNKENEKHNALNSSVALFAKDEIVRSLERKNKHTLLTNNVTTHPIKREDAGC